MPAAVKLSICAIASEVVPFAKTGGLADVASALSRQLTARGHDVRLFVPFYAQIRRDELDAARVESLQGLSIIIGRHEYRVDIWRARLPGSATPGIPGRVGRAVCATQALHQRPRRAPPLPGADARRARVLPAHEFPAAHRAFARLARRVRAAVAALELQGRSGVRRHPLGADHPQHRLPGRIQRHRRRRPRSRLRHLSTSPGRPARPGTSTRSSTASCTPTRSPR